MVRYASINGYWFSHALIFAWTVRQELKHFVLTWEWTILMLGSWCLLGMLFFFGHFTGPFVHSDLYPNVYYKCACVHFNRKMKAEKQGYFSKVSLRVASHVAILTCILISWLSTICHALIQWMCNFFDGWRIRTKHILVQTYV